MKINVSKATFSSIVGIGQKVKKAAKETGIPYLELNRGVNAVTEINLSEVIPQIDFQSKEIQVYAPNLGLESLRKSIIQEYFPSLQNQPGSENLVAITPGGMPALDLVMQILNVENIYFPKFYWGSYSKMATIRGKSFSFYSDLHDFDISGLNDSSCIFICDPSNPTGVKMDDFQLLCLIEDINKTGAVVIFDCPYRKLFYQQSDFFDKLTKFKNVIITESFSKWVGLSGLRLGFIFSQNSDFREELNIRLLYEFNAVSAISQKIIEKVISTDEGKKAHTDFRLEATRHIKLNINYLAENGFLSKEIYGNGIPLGIFAVINKTEDFLFQNKIGAVGMDKFVYHDKDTWSAHSRICVSVPNDEFVKFFDKIKEK